MSVPDSTVPRGRALQSLDRRPPSRYYADSDDTDTDDDRHLPHSQRQQQQQPPRSPRLSLRRILAAQRNLQQLRGEHHPTRQDRDAAFAVSGTNDSISRSPLPSFRLAAQASQAVSTSRLGVLRPRGQGQPRESIDGRCVGSAASVRDAAECPGEKLNLVAGRHHSPQSPPPPPALLQPVDNTSSETASGGFGHSRRRTMTPQERRVARTCTIEGCTNYIVDRHLCFRHGGGRRCSIDGCTSSAKQFGLCWRHGGSVLCKIEGCTRGVKVKGFCWGHGGGKKKNQQATSAPEGTSTVTKETASSSASEFRCLVDGCQNAPVIHSFCDTHCREVTRPGYVFEL